MVDEVAFWIDYDPGGELWTDGLNKGLSGDSFVCDHMGGIVFMLWNHIF